MALFDWQDIYSVGVESIDNQHKKLFEIANRFHAAYERREARKVLASIFAELVEYTVYHFTDEERLLREHNYAEFDRHKANHEKLVNLVLGYRRQLEGGEPEVEPHAMNFVKTWLTGHVLGMDRNYKDCLNPATR
jgi:hemerythrin-like metal-binding protein